MLGAHLLARTDTGWIVLRITEVEAYGGQAEDPGSHAHRGATARNASMFGPVGHAYAYFTYGIHWCLNVVAHDQHRAGGILLRAGEVIEGVEEARARRPAARRDTDLARGPARLAVTLGVQRRTDGVDLMDPTGALHLRLCAPLAPDVIGVGPRTGVSGAGASTPWRFWLVGDPTVSPYRPHRVSARPPAAGGGHRPAPPAQDCGHGQG